MKIKTAASEQLTTTFKDAKLGDVIRVRGGDTLYMKVDAVELRTFAEKSVGNCVSLRDGLLWFCSDEASIAFVDAELVVRS
jgi:hypothetical protein